MSVGVFRLRALSYLFNYGVGIVEGHRSRVTLIPPEEPTGKYFWQGIFSMFLCFNL